VPLAVARSIGAMWFQLKPASDVVTTEPRGFPSVSNPN
jgi:hypothetical protein